MPISVVLFLSRRLQAVAAALLLLSALQVVRSAPDVRPPDAGPGALRGPLAR